MSIRGTENRHVDLLEIRMEFLAPDRWRDLRRLRLRALRDAPGAFLSDLRRETRWSEAAWRRLTQESRWAVAVHGGQAIGIARSTGDEERPHQRHLESVWVEPLWRRRHIAERLVRWLIEQSEPEVTDILIWVIVPNPAARRLYEGIGFRPTGERQSLAGQGERVEEQMRLPLRRRRSRPQALLHGDP